MKVFQDVQLKEEDGRETLNETKKNMDIINSEEIRKIKKIFKNL